MDRGMEFRFNFSMGMITLTWAFFPLGLPQVRLDTVRPRRPTLRSVITFASVYERLGGGLKVSASSHTCERRKGHHPLRSD
jgi:hypothetical protein